VRSVTVKASTQVGKTLTLIGALLYCAEHDPAPAMIVCPDESSAIEFRDRLYANASATIAGGGATRIRVPKPWRWNRRYVDLGTMRVYLAWSQARQRLRGRPCRRVLLTEIDVYEGDKRAGDPIEQSHQRTKAFRRALHYHESSPTEHPSPISTLEAKASARYRWHCQCPHCGHQQELRFFVHASGPYAERGGIGGLKDAGGELLATEKARAGAHYVCETGCRIEDVDKQRFIAAGRWVLYGSDPAAESPPADRRSLGYHLWAIHSETQSFGDLAASYVEAVEEGKLRDWWGNTLGLAYRPKQKIPQWYDVGTRLAASHPRGCLPAEAWFLTAGKDVQGDASGCRYVIRAWGAHRTSWLVDWGWVERTEDDADGSLVRGDLRIAGDEILGKQFPVHGGATTKLLGASSLAVRLLCCDSGHSPKAVHAWMRSLPEAWVVGEGTERVRAVKGDGALNGVRYQRSVVERNVRTGEEYEGGMAVWRLAVAELYPDLVERLFAPAGKPGSWHVTSDTLTLGKSYLQQVCNLERRVIIDKRGRKKIEWGPRSHQIPVDFCDCEVYAEFAAEMVVGSMGWDPGPWEEWAKQRKQQARTSAPVRRRESEHEDLADR
jgi:phage terminase large subunit GpA-like protein